MNEQEKQLQELREQKLVNTASRIYTSAITEVLFEAEVKKENIEYVLLELLSKVKFLSKGYIDITTYQLYVEEKTGITLK